VSQIPNKNIPTQWQPTRQQLSITTHASSVTRSETVLIGIFDVSLFNKQSTSCSATQQHFWDTSPRRSILLYPRQYPRQQKRILCSTPYTSYLCLSTSQQHHKSGKEIPVKEMKMISHIESLTLPLWSWRQSKFILMSSTNTNKEWQNKSLGLGTGDEPLTASNQNRLTCLVVYLPAAVSLASGIGSDWKRREGVGGMVCLPHLVRWAVLGEVLWWIMMLTCYNPFFDLLSCLPRESGRGMNRWLSCHLPWI
jgi:hypothetical protein